MAEQRARLFVALELPEPVRAALVRWRARAVEGALGLRLLAPEDLHVTLCFLGSRSVVEIDAIASACAALERRPAVESALGGALWLPARRPRVLAAELDDPEGTLASTQAQLSGALRAGGWYAPGARPFLAHVTVARVGKGARLRRRELRRPKPLRFTGSTVTLYRSRPEPVGARYEALCSVGLRAAGGG
ncbi:MAG: RNA 2',3'-cyclic phosphodiesterase [Solirubrobacterales bacterium]|nr:MAG: RNA 2',3'-cyclic phosphodiesterase [Solirubrobacterales bacterium]